MSEESQAQIRHPLYPLGPEERLRCEQCDEIMEWDRHTAVFECDCRDLGVSAEAIKHSRDISLFDVTVE